MTTSPDTDTGPGIYHIGAATVRFPTFAQTHEGALTQEGWNYQIGGTIEGLSGAGVQIYNNAVSIIQRIPVSPLLMPGAAIAGYPFSILREYRVVPVSNGVVEFGCIFRGLTPGPGNTNVIKTGYTAQQIERNLDLFGNLIKVLPPASITADATLVGDLASIKEPQTKTVSAFTPQGNIEVTRLELGGSPVGDVETYTGSVNGGACPWSHSAKPRTWMCMGIEQESHDLGVTWTRTYRFQKAPILQQTPLVTGWDVVVAFIDPRSGNAPGGPTGVPALIAVNPGTSSNNAYQLAPVEDFTIFGFIFLF